MKVITSVPITFLRVREDGSHTSVDCSWQISTPSIDMNVKDPADDNIMNEKRFPHHCPCVKGIHQSPGDSPHTGLVMREFDSDVVIPLLVWVVEQTFDFSAIWDAMVLICRYSKDMLSRVHSDWMLQW